MTRSLSIDQVADEVARALSYAKLGNQGANIVTPLVYPGGTRVVLRIQESSEGFFVSDNGSGRNEAELMGGRQIFTRIARVVAERFSVRFDSDMMFDLDVPREALVAAAIAVANATKHAVDHTAEKLSEIHAGDLRTKLWERLAAAFPTAYLARETSFVGASAAEWKFDAIVEIGGIRSIFDIVSPHPTSVHAAVSKFLDVKDLGDSAPSRIAVTADFKNTPHLPLLGRTAKILDISSRIEAYKHAA